MTARDGSKVSVFLWMDGTALDAANLYTSLFPDAKILSINKSPSDWPGGKAGDTLTVEMEFFGNQRMVLMNGGAGPTFNESVSIAVTTDSTDETDRYWDGLLANGGEPMACGWLKDKFGVRWQITPRVLTEGLTHPNPAVVTAVFGAMNSMIKIDGDKIEEAMTTALKGAEGGAA